MFAKMTVKCEISHKYIKYTKYAKHTQLVQYKTLKNIAHTVLQVILNIQETDLNVTCIS
jgi:hypothetical protein